METRRSKRLLTKETVAAPTSSSEEKKKRPPVPRSKKSTKKSDSPAPVTSDYFDSQTNSENSDELETKTRRKTKSSYFESPVVSEDSESSYEPEPLKSRKKSKILQSPEPSESDESDYESDPPATKRAKRNRNSIANKQSTKIPKCDGSGDEFVATRKPVSKNSFIKPVPIPTTKNCFESESDSSSDDFEPAPQSLLDLPKPKSVSPVTAFDSEEDVPTESTTEYFDFTTLLSQVGEAKDDKPEVKDEKPSAVAEKTPKAEKKPKRAKKPTKAVESTSESMDVCELLAMGENTDLSAKDIKASVSQSTENYEIPKQVEILLDAPKVMKKKRCNDLEMALRRRLNNIRRENQVYIHKVHILCWIAHGNYLNSILNDPEILSVALSLLPSDKCYPPKRMSLEYLEDLIKWFGNKVKLNKEPVDCKFDQLTTLLPTFFQKREVDNKTYFCFMFICLVRALGIRCRLIINLNVAPMKPTSDQLLPVNQKNEDEPKPKASTSKPTKEIKLKEKPVKKEEKHKRNSTKSKEKEKKPKEEKSKNSTKSKDDSAYFKKTDGRRSARLVNSSSKYFEEGSDEEPKSSTSKRGKTPKKSKTKEPETNHVEEMSSSSESDFDETFVSSKKKKIDRRVLSSEEETREGKSTEPVKSSKEKNKNNYWLEVFLEAEEKWFCIDIVKKSFLCVKQLYSSASQPVRYILAWNQDQSIKDVTRRYAPQFLTVTRKLRIEENWWSRTMRPYKPPNTPQNREEDEELDKMLEEQDLPTAISEYKNHPLYALERHLLKFQGIYPPDAPPLGYVKGEPVYSRLCVHQLHGREMWIKEAKVVKMNETPYKIVKGRPQRTKMGTTEPPKDLELFGSWQVQDYVPPAAENGKVPRNAFGNVELFKPSMLPKGTVYLQLPGLQRIASKLNIDCAAAIVGFEYSTNGWSYPVKDGFVVCEEFKEILLDAYNQEIEEAEKKEIRKREERVYGNWRRLFKAMFIREKLKRKYNFGVEPDTSTSSKETKKTTTKAEK